MEEFLNNGRPDPLLKFRPTVPKAHAVCSPESASPWGSPFASPLDLASPLTTLDLTSPMLKQTLLAAAASGILADDRRVNEPLVPYALEPLQWGDVRPAGWLHDWALSARHGAASPERAAFATEQMTANGHPGCVEAPPSPPPAPGNECASKQENTDQEGGHDIPGKTLWNITDAECCKACMAEPNCDVWITGLLNFKAGDPFGCWLAHGPTGKGQKTGRAAGFVRNDPAPGPVKCESVNGWLDGRPSSDSFWDEDSAYWIDGMTRLGLVLHDETLQARTKEDIDAVLANPIYFHNTWKNEHDLGRGSAEGWVRSVYSRAMLAHVDGTGDASVLKFLEKAFSNYTAKDSTSDRSLTQIEALLEGHAYGGPVSMRDTALAMMETNPTSQGFLKVLLSGCTTDEKVVAAGGCDVPATHGVSWSEISKLFAVSLMVAIGRSVALVQISCSLTMFFSCLADGVQLEWQHVLSQREHQRVRDGRQVSRAGASVF